MASPQLWLSVVWHMVRECSDAIQPTILSCLTTTLGFPEQTYQIRRFKAFWYIYYGWRKAAVGTSMWRSVPQSEPETYRWWLIMATTSLPWQWAKAVQRPVVRSGNQRLYVAHCCENEISSMTAQLLPFISIHSSFAERSLGPWAPVRTAILFFTVSNKHSSSYPALVVMCVSQPKMPIH
jgi:hypothetical protein